MRIIEGATFYNKIVFHNQTQPTRLWPEAPSSYPFLSSAMFDYLACPAILLSQVFDLVLFHQLWVSRFGVRASSNFGTRTPIGGLVAGDLRLHQPFNRGCHTIVVTTLIVVHPLCLFGREAGCLLHE